jgi:hypothetical protein
MSTRIVL